LSHLRNRKFWLIILLGVVLRAAALSLPGTDDMLTNQVWGARALEQGITRVYMYDDSYLINRIISRWTGVPYPDKPLHYQTQIGLLDYTPNYPPLSMYLFWLSTWVCSLLEGGKLVLGGLLNACFNFVPVVCALVTALLAWVFVKKEGLARPLTAVAAFWLNPIMIYHTPVLGYVDSVFALFGFGALILLYRKKFTGAAVLLALSCAIKPQGVLILPVAALVILAERNRRLAVRLAGIFFLVFLASFLPFILTGHGIAALRGNIQVLGLAYLSSQQANIWWLVSWLLPAVGRRSLALLANEVVMQPYPEFGRIFHLNARLVAGLLLLTFVVLLLYFLWKELKGGNRLAIFWAAAFGVCGYTMLSLYPHENHLYPFFVYALPVLALSRRAFMNVYLLLSVIFGLNNYFFNGLGRGMTAAALGVRMAFGFDLTVAVSLLYVGVFLWVIHGRRWLFDLTRQSPRQAPGN
jgi:hypothetical protein